MSGYGANRPITIAFIDLVGSTRIARGYSPDESQEIILKYRDAVEPAVERYGGYVARAFGDGLLVCFGHPHAHEDDPERALRSAAEAHLALKALSEEDGVTYRTHIGIATSLVLIGDEASRTRLQSDELFGEAPILAKNLQDLAGPSETVICETTWQRVREQFECEMLAPAWFKNYEEPVTAYRVQDEISGVRRLANANRRPSSNLLGRKSELDDLMDGWSSVRQNGLQVVALSGDAGIGKTRLLNAHRRHPALGRHHCLVYKCLTHYQKTPFFAFITQMELWMGIRADDSTETRLEKLRKHAAPMLDETLFATASALIAPTRAGDALLANLPEKAFHARVVEIFVTFMEHGARERPILVHFEDAHWIDPSSRRLLREGLPRIQDLPIQFVISHRCDFEPDFLPEDATRRLHLGALSGDAAREMVLAVPGADVLDAQTIDRIVSTTQGVPLFIEHYTRTILNGLRLTGKLPLADEPAPLPDQIYGLLFQQLDDAGPDRGVALAATAIGGSFDTELLAAAAGMNAEDTQPVIDRLIDQGLFAQSATDTDLAYRFTHAMVLEAGYHSLVKIHKKSLHERIAQYLDAERPELAERYPELLARQFRLAGIHDKAIEMYLQAGGRALARFANHEAVLHAERGIKLLPNLSDAARPWLEMQLHLLLGLADSALSGFGVARTLDAFRAAFDQSEALEDPRSFLRAAQGLYSAHFAHANYGEAGTIGRRIRSFAGKITDTRKLELAESMADRIEGSALIWQGEFSTARMLLERRFNAIGSGAESPAQDPAAHQTLASLGLVEAFTGNAAKATRLAEDAIAAARERGTPMAIGNAMLMACNIHQILRHPNAASHAAALEQYAIEQNMPFYVWGARSFMGVALYQDEDRVEEGYLLLNEAWPEYQRTAARANQVFVCVERAEGCRLMRRPAAGLESIEKGLRLVETFGERNFEAELHRLRGVLLHDLGDNTGEATGVIETALQIARSQSSRLFELRALMDLGELAVQGRADPGYLTALADLLDTWPEDDSLPELARAAHILGAASSHR